MDLPDIAFAFNVKAKGYDEKVKLIQGVAREMGYNGITTLAPLIGFSPSQLSRYAQLDLFFEDRKRGRHNREPLPRITAGEAIGPEIYEQLLLSRRKPKRLIC